MGGIFGGGGGQNTVDPVAAGLRVQTSAYGLVLPLVYGRTRVTGNLIWFGDFTPIPHTTQQSGGKGGGGSAGSNTSYTYTTSFALGLCEGAINQVYGGWRDKDILTLAQINAMFTTFTGASGQTAWSYLTTSHAGQDLVYQKFAYVAAANYDLQTSSSLQNHSFEIGGKFSSSGVGTNIAVTFTAPTLGSAISALVAVTSVNYNPVIGLTGGYGTTYALSATAGSFVAGDIIQFQTTGALPTGLALLTNYTVLGMSGIAFTVANSINSAVITLVNTGTGTLTAKKQTYAATINATAHGLPNDMLVNLSGAVPAPFTTGNDYYVVNTATNTFGLSGTVGGTAINATASGSGNVFTMAYGGNPRDIVVDFLSAPNYGAGFPVSKFGDLTDYSAFCIANGLYLSPAYDSANPAQQMVTDLMQITNSSVFFSEGLMKIVPMSDTNASGNGANYYAPNTALYNLTDDDFIVSGGDPIKVIRNSSADAFNQIQVEFINGANQYNVEIAETRDQAAVETYGLLTQNPITAHMITDAVTARKVAQMILQRTLFIRNTYEFTLSWKYCLLEPTDIVTLTDYDLGLDHYAVRILSHEESDTGEINFTAEDYPAGVTHSAVYPSTAGVGWSVNYNVTGGMVATPSFVEVPATLSNTGLKIGVAVTGSAVDWGGCEIWVSYDGTTYKRLGKNTGGARYGVTSNTITSAAGQVQNVTLTGNGGQILSGSTTESANLATLCLIEDEYVAHTTATLLSANNYGLTLANRGAYQTAPAAHTSGKKFVRIDSAIVYSDDLDLSMIGKTLHFKFLSFNRYGGARQALSDVVDYTYTITGVMAHLPPTDVASITTALSVNGLTLNWTDITDGDRKDYEVRSGATWATAASLGFFGSNSANLPPQAAGSYTFQVKARDLFLNYSNNPASVGLTVAAPLAPTVTSSIIGAEFKLSWTAPTSAFAIDHYEIRTGTVWSSGTYVGTSGGQTYQAPVKFSGTVNYMVAAVDAAGNVGAAGSSSIVIVVPTAPTVTTQVVDNNVLFYWNDTHQTLPIATYELRKGSTFSSAAVIGTKAGLFTTIFETVAGTFTYWVVAIDTAGNYGTPTSTAATVNAPPDYVLKANFNSTLNGTLSNAVSNLNGINLPINTADQFGTHFSSHSWTSLQAQITAGYPILVEPAASSGYYEEVIDYGVTFASSKVTLSPATQIIDGAPTVTYTISTSPDNVTYTDFVGVTQVFGTNFRYVKVRVAAASSAGADLMTLTALNVRLDVKLKNDAGSVSAVSTDNSAAITGAAIGGTTVLFNVPFINVTSIVLTPQGTTTALTAIYDFIGSTVNPLGFKVYLYNAAGTRVSGNVSWSVKGY